MYDIFKQTPFFQSQVRQCKRLHCYAVRQLNGDLYHTIYNPSVKQFPILIPLIPPTGTLPTQRSPRRLIKRIQNIGPQRILNPIEYLVPGVQEAPMLEDKNATGPGVDVQTPFIGGEGGGG
jgi:hypothetical protein